MPHEKKAARNEVMRQLNDLPDHIETITRLHDFHRDLLSQKADGVQTRSMIIVAGGLLEHGLGTAIESLLSGPEKLKRKIMDGSNEGSGILSSLYARSVLGRALDIYGDQTLEDIHTVRTVRNMCAHAKSDTDLYTKELEPLGRFQSSITVSEITGSKETRGLGIPVSMPQGVMLFLLNFIPYLLHFPDETWRNGSNHKSWRQIFD